MFRIAFSRLDIVVTLTEIQFLLSYGIGPWGVDVKLEGIQTCYSRSNTWFSSVSVVNDGHKPLSQALVAIRHAGCVKDMPTWAYAERSFTSFGSLLHFCHALS